MLKNFMLVLACALCFGMAAQDPPADFTGYIWESSDTLPDHSIFSAGHSIVKQYVVFKEDRSFERTVIFCNQGKRDSLIYQGRYKPTLKDGRYVFKTDSVSINTCGLTCDRKYRSNIEMLNKHAIRWMGKAYKKKGLQWEPVFSLVNLQSPGKKIILPAEVYINVRNPDHIKKYNGRELACAIDSVKDTLVYVRIVNAFRQDFTEKNSLILDVANINFIYFPTEADERQLSLARLTGRIGGFLSGGIVAGVLLSAPVLILPSAAFFTAALTLYIVGQGNTYGISREYYHTRKSNYWQLK